ncbi:hypothetical protein JCM16138_18070 [Thermococcus atlanticus]
MEFIIRLIPVMKTENIDPVPAESIMRDEESVNKPPDMRNP